MARLSGLLAILVVMAACTSDPDPHQLGSCKNWTINGGMPFTGQCELACQTPPTPTGTKCDTAIAMQCASFDFNGQHGCCFPEQAAGPIRFYPCF